MPHCVPGSWFTTFTRNLKFDVSEGAEDVLVVEIRHADEGESDHDVHRIALDRGSWAKLVAKVSLHL